MSEDPTRPGLILVLGMHRSGTSAAARLVNLLGASLGRRLLDAQMGVNDKGFWENSELVALNEAILATRQSAWYDNRAWPAKWWRDPAFDPLRSRLQQFLTEEFAGIPLAALKDPRLCRTLPLWLEAAADAGWDCRCLLVLRSPDEVRASLLRRDPFGPLTADLLWLRSLLDLAPAGLPALTIPSHVLSYNALLTDPLAEARRIRAALPGGWVSLEGAAGEQLRRQLREEIDPAMRRQKGNSEQESPLSEPLRALYPQLTGIRSLPQLQEQLKRLLAAADLSLPSGEAGELLWQGNRQLVALSDQLQQLGGELLEARQVIDQRDQDVRELDQRLSRIGQEHDQALETLRQRDADLARLASELEHAVGVVAERDQQLVERQAEFEQLRAWTDQVEQQARENWERYEQAQQLLNRIRRHPLMRPLLHLFGLQDHS